MSNTMADHALRAVVRGQLLQQDVPTAAAHALRERAETLRADGERGAQAAEYAMLGGVSAAACGGLIAILSRTEILEKLVNAVVGALVNVVGRWF